MIRKSCSAILLGFVIIVNGMSITPVYGMTISASLEYSHSSTTLGNIGKIGLAVGAVGLATYGAAKLGSWLWGQSDEKIVLRAQQACKEASANYINVISLLQKEMSDMSSEDAMNMPETLLYQLATLKYHEDDIATYCKKLKQTIGDLEGYHKSLVKRMNNLSMSISQNYQLMMVYNRMKNVETQLIAILPQLHVAYLCFKTHEPFFSLFELEDKLAYRYERDLHAVQIYRDDLPYLRQMVHQSVMLQQANHRSSYPYHWYLNKLEDDMAMLARAIDRLPVLYFNRSNVARTLYNNLLLIKQTIVTSSYYAEEIRSLEHAQLMNASIAAQEHQAQELAHQNAIAHQQLALQQEALTRSNQEFLQDDF